MEGKPFFISSRIIIRRFLVRNFPKNTTRLAFLWLYIPPTGHIDWYFPKQTFAPSKISLTGQILDWFHLSIFGFRLIYSVNFVVFICFADWFNETYSFKCMVSRYPLPILSRGICVIYGSKDRNFQVTKNDLCMNN